MTENQYDTEPLRTDVAENNSEMSPQHNTVPLQNNVVPQTIAPANNFAASPAPQAPVQNPQNNYSAYNPAPQNALPAYGTYSQQSYSSPTQTVYPQVPMQAYPNPDAGNGLSITSIVLGVVGMGFLPIICNIIGIVLGVLGAKANKENGGKGTLGKIGWVLNVVFLSLTILLIIVVILILATLPYNDLYA